MEYSSGKLSVNLILPENWGWVAVAIAVAAIVTVLWKKMDVPGAVAGFFIALAIYLGGGFQRLILLLAFFVAGSLASRWKIRQKQEAGIAEPNKGRRSINNALANGGVAAICGLLAWLQPANASTYLAMLAASLASATADTLSSELGNVYGSRYVNILSLQPEKRGLDGVVSMEGTLIGAVGSLMIAILYALGADWSWLALIVFLAGILGNLFDSILGATLQRKGYLNNDTVNFANTLFAALITYVFAMVM